MIKVGSIKTSQQECFNVTEIDIDFKSELALNHTIGTVTIKLPKPNQDLANQIESAVKRAVTKYNKNKNK